MTNCGIDICNSVEVTSNDVVYNGPALANINVSTNATLTSVLSSINSAICPAGVTSLFMSALQDNVPICIETPNNLNNEDCSHDCFPDNTERFDCIGDAGSLICDQYFTCACPEDEVLIGSQIWTVKNLDVTTYRNGDVIPQVTNPTAWAALTTGAWCYYNNDSVNGPIYGKLYNWYAVNDVRGLAPIGYHIPTDAEWTILSTNLGGNGIAGGKMKSKTGWYSGGNGTNCSCFTGLPGGNRNYIGSFNNVGYYGWWWSASEYNTLGAWFWGLYYGSIGGSRGHYNKLVGQSIRLIKD
jgi:uncharacterized protein (TIGR02145 family)